MAAVARTAAAQEVALQARFAQHDANGDGKVDAAQARAVLEDALRRGVLHTDEDQRIKQFAEIMDNLDEPVDFQTFYDSLRSVGIGLMSVPEGIVPDHLATGISHCGQLQPEPHPEPEPQLGPGPQGGVRWDVYIRSQGSALVATLWALHEIRKWKDNKGTVGTILSLLLSLVLIHVKQLIFAFTVECLRTVVLFVPFMVLLLLVAPLPASVKPFPYLVVWRLLVGGASAWFGQWALIGFIAIFVLTQALFFMPKSSQQQERMDQIQHRLVDLLFKKKYRPRVDGKRYAGIDMSGFGRFPPLCEGLDGVYEFTNYNLLTVFSGLWLLVYLLWPWSDSTASGRDERGLWIALLSFLLYVVAAYIHKLKGEIRELRKRE